MWQGTFYCGTADGYHYLVHKTRLWDRVLRIRVESLDIDNVQKFPLKEDQWQSIAELIPLPAAIRDEKTPDDRPRQPGGGSANAVAD
jgi:hypothetical protein